MSNNICSNAFRRFFEELRIDLVTKNDIMNNIIECIRPLVKELEYTSLCISLDAPANGNEKNGVAFDITLYGPEITPANCSRRECQFITGEGGLFNVIACIPEAVVWTAEDEESFRIVAKELYIILGRARLMDMLRYMETHDLLSRALNMEGMLISARKLMSDNPSIVYDCVAINIKNLKYVNDKATQSGGNIAINKYASNIIEYLGADGRVARTEGDNFVVLINHERLGHFLEYLKNIRLDITVEDKTMYFDMPCSAGVFLGGGHTPLNVMLNKSILTLNYLRDYKLGDSMFYTPELETKVNYYKGILGRFRNAINNKQFSVFYQPKVNIEEKKLIGAEALVRWFDNGVFISPMEFIPILEREGLISTLDYYVFERACEDIRRWLDQGIEPVRISTNFSKDNLKNINLVRDILDIVDRYGIEGKYLEIEFTELCEYKDLAIMDSFVQAMQAHGITITIDDFGKGYSSFDLIRMLDMNVIKIDKSLVDNICAEGSSDRIILDYIVRMFVELNKEVIAEGVETQEQALLLEKLGCKHIQGYLFDKPLPHYDFERRLVTENYYVKKL